MKCRLTTLTPCHIGSGNILNRNMDFCSDRDKIGIIDCRKIFDIVGERGIAAWCSWIEKRENILASLKKVRPNIKLEDISSRVLEIYGGNNTVIGLREQITTLGNPYIPGSSIKGAIVSALLASEASESLICSKGVNPRDNKIIDQMFSVARNVNGDRSVYDPKTSALRFLRVSDAYYDNKIENLTIALYCKSMNIINGGNEVCLDNKLQQYVEAIYVEKGKAEFELEIRQDYLREVQSQKVPLGKIPQGMNSLKDLLRCINSHTMNLLEREEQFWSAKDISNGMLDEYLDSIKEYKRGCENFLNNGKSAILRLGYGSGWEFITGGWSRIKSKKHDWNRIVDNARPNNQKYYSEYDFPKTRRLIDNDGEYLPLGFVQIDVVEDK